MRLRLCSICKSFDRPVLNGVSLGVAQSETLVILGPSGSGKSTLLRIISGLTRQDAGEVYWDDRRIDPMPAHLRQIGFVFQSPVFLPGRSVAENIMLPLECRRLLPWRRFRPASRRLAATFAARFGVDHLLDRDPATLSRGEQQRVALARAMVKPSPLLLLDEPLSSLDGPARAKLRDEIVSLRRETRDRNSCMVYVTHDRNEAMMLADRIAVLDVGVIQQIGTPRELYVNPANRFVAEILAFPTIRFVHAEVARHDRHSVIKMPWNTEFCVPQRELPERITLGIRPEAVSLVDSNGIPGRIANRTYFGDRMLLEIRLGRETVDAWDDIARSRADGEEVRCVIRRDNLTAFHPASGRRIPLDWISKDTFR